MTTPLEHARAHLRAIVWATTAELGIEQPIVVEDESGPVGAFGPPCPEQQPGSFGSFFVEQVTSDGPEVVNTAGARWSERALLINGPAQTGTGSIVFASVDGGFEVSVEEFADGRVVVGGYTPCVVA